MWTRKPRQKLTIHTTSRHISDGEKVRGSGKFLVAAIGILLLINHFLPNWFPEPEDFKPATVPIERVVPEPDIEKTVEKIPEPPPVEAKKIPDWKRYAVSAQLEDGKAKIAIVIDDMGVNLIKSREVLEMPGVLTLSFLPYADKVAEMAQLARHKGHEVMVHIPMEPLDPTINPGPNALLTSMMPEELKTAVDANLSKLTGYVGINNHMGSRFTQDTVALQELMKILKERGLFLLDSKTIAASQAYSEAKAIGVPAVERDVFLDDDPAYASVERQMLLAETMAKKKGTAIVIGHPKDDTIRVLKEFLARAETDGIQVVPLSALVRMSETENVVPVSLQQPAPAPEPSVSSP